MQRTRGVLEVVVGAAGLASVAWTVGSGVATPDVTVSAVLIPAMFVLAGLLGPIWSAAPFTCRMLTAVGVLHLLAIALSALAQRGMPPAAWEHALSQVLFVSGFALLVPLAVGFPSGSHRRWPWLVVVLAAGLPVLAAFSAPTPVVLQVTDPPRLLGPVEPLLPTGVAAAVPVVFLLPGVAVAVAIVRVVRDGRETRGRLALPLAALVVFALLVATGGVLPPGASAAGAALFLVSAPLVPVGLVMGSRPVAPTPQQPVPPLLDDAQLARLSPRERDVLEGMARGESNAAIARRLHISQSAVEKRTTAVFTKLDLAPDAGTHRRVAAVVAYLRSVDR